MHDLRELKDEGEAGSDDEHRAEVELQKLTDARIAEIDASSRPRKRRSSRSDAGTGTRGRRRGGRRIARYVAIITDGNGRWARGAASPSTRATSRAPTRSRRACVTPSTSGSGADRVLVLDRELGGRRRRSGPDGMHSARIAGETPELHEEGVRMRFIGRREGIDLGARAADGLGGGLTAPTIGSRCSSHSTTAGAPRSRRGAALPGRRRRSSEPASTPPRCTIRS